MLAPLKIIDLTDSQTDKLQQNLDNFLRPVSLNPLMDGVFLEDISLLNGAINHIPHGLRRATRGYLVCKRSISNNTAVGGAKIWLSSTAPSGWLICDGTAISRTTYASLFNRIGTTYGVGDGTTTFNIPDFRQRFPLGKAAAGTGSTLGSTGGVIDHTHTVPAHFHGVGTGADLNIVASGSHAHALVTPGAAGGLVTITNAIGGNGSSQLGFIPATTHTHLTTDFAGRIGLVTGGVDGNSAMTSGTQNPPFLSVNFIIQTDNFDVNSSVWDGESANVLKDSFLDLYAAANMTVSLWIF